LQVMERDVVEVDDGRPPGKANAVMETDAGGSSARYAEKQTSCCAPSAHSVWLSALYFVSVLCILIAVH